MQFPYYFCTNNQYLPKLQCKINQPSFSLSEFLFFLDNIQIKDTLYTFKSSSH